MALINRKEIKTVSPADLYIKLAELEKELMKYNAQIAMGTIPKNPGIVSETKKAIAKIKTLLHEKEIKTEKFVEEKKKDDRRLS